MTEVYSSSGVCPACEGTVPDHYAFCPVCLTGVPVRGVRRALLSLRVNAILLVATFYLEGLVYPIWPTFAYLLYLYFHALIITLRVWPSERRFLVELALVVLLANSFFSVYNVPLIWFTIGVLVSSGVLLFSRLGVDELLTALPGLGIMFFLGEALLSGASITGNLMGSVERLQGWLISQGGLGQWNDIVTIGCWLSLRLFVASVVLVGIGNSYRSARAITVGPFLAAPSPFHGIRPIELYARAGLRTRGWLARLIEAWKLAALAILRTLVNIARVFWNQVLAACHAALTILVYTLDGILRTIVYLARLVWVMVREIAAAGSRAALHCLQSLAVSSLILIIPAAMSALVLKLAFRLATVIATYVRQDGPVAFVGLIGLTTVAALLALIGGAWSIRPRGDETLWWRHMIGNTTGIKLEVMTELSRAKAHSLALAVGNYLLGFGPRLFFVYFLTLFTFDSMGWAGYGPYRFGWTSGLCLVLVLALGAVWMVLRQKESGTC